MNEIIYLLYITLFTLYIFYIYRGGPVNRLQQGNASMNFRWAEKRRVR